mgnify:CR=1 FL=1
MRNLAFLWNEEVDWQQVEIAVNQKMNKIILREYKEINLNSWGHINILLNIFLLFFSTQNWIFSWKSLKGKRIQFSTSKVYSCIDNPKHTFQFCCFLMVMQTYRKCKYLNNRWMSSKLLITLFLTLDQN